MFGIGVPELLLKTGALLGLLTGLLILIGGYLGGSQGMSIAFVMIVIGLVIGFIASRINKTLGTSLFAGILGSWVGGIGMAAMIAKDYHPDIVGIFTYVSAVLGSLIFVFVTHLVLLKNRLSANSPAASQNFPEAPISQFCTQCGNPLKAGLRFCPSCGTAAQ